MLSKNQSSKQINLFKGQFLQMDIPDIMDSLDTEQLLKMIEEGIKEIPHKLRERIWTPVVTLFAFAKQLLNKGSCSDAVKSVQAEQIRAGKTPCSGNTSAYCQARQELPEDLLWNLVRYTGHQLDRESQMHWRWRGRPVKFADGSTATMSDTPANQEVYPQEPNQEEGLGFPILPLEIIASLNSGSVLDCGVGPYAGKGTGESTLFRHMLPDNIEFGDITLMDQYYENFWTELSLINNGVDMLCPMRGNRKIEWKDYVKLGDYYDRLFEIKKPRRPEWMTVQEYNAAPEKLTMRIFRIYGRTYVTTMVNPRHYRKNALRKLYQQRWHIEVDLRFIKRVMNMEPLRCKTPEMVRKEIAVTLFAYNLIRMVMAQAGIIYHVWPRYISFKETLSTFREFSGDLARATGAELLRLVKEVLKIVASKTIGNRKGRVEPRAIKRRHTKGYPYLTTPRRAKNDEKPKNQNSYQAGSSQIDGRSEMCASLT
jgi:hypothetical protein